MLKKLMLTLALTSVLLPVAVAADLQVVDGVITTAIEKQMPVDRIEKYPADYGKLFCFTRIVGAENDTSVTHIWYYQDDELARVELAVKSADWRTYSSKRFLPQWGGDWRVVVLDAAGNQLAEIPFVLE